MIFKNVKSLNIPEGVVTRITSGGIVLWEQQSGNYQDIYQRVDYIESDGNQYINTNYIADNQTGMELNASFFYGVCENGIPMGSRATGSNTYFYAPYPVTDTYSKYGFNTENQISVWSASHLSQCRLRINFCNNRRVEISEENMNMPSTSLSGTLAQQTSPIGIFTCLSGNGVADEKCRLRFSGAKISQGSEVVREYIPCYRKSDNVVGIYEIYTNTFLTNSGSGEFEIGNEIDW